MDFKNAKVVKTEPLETSDAKWIRLKRIHYTDPTSRTRTYESAERQTRPKNSNGDGVGIVCVLDKPSGKEILLQKQYRPAIDRVCIEVPAGLIDEGETAEQTAIRELKEETGYVGTLAEGEGFQMSPLMFNDPGFCNTNLYMVHVHVDMTREENKKPKPQLEENEFIECFSVSLARMWEECQRLEREGYAIDARVGTLAEGIECARRFNLFS